MQTKANNTLTTSRLEPLNPLNLLELLNFELLPFVPSPALDLCLTRLAQLRIGPVLQQQIGALLVVEDAAETVAVPGCREPRRDARFAHRVDVRALLDQQFEEGVPSPVPRSEQRVFAVGGGSLCIGAELEQECDRIERLRLGDRTLTNPSI